MSNKTICFLLSGYVDYPIGGYKIVYEYANRLVSCGYEVSIFFVKYSRKAGFLRTLARHPWKVFSSFFAHPKITWFKLDRRIKTRCIYSSALITRGMPADTMFIATELSTAFALNEVKAANKFYFVQDKEVWPPYTEEDVYASYRFDMRKITISEWLADEIRKCGSDAAIVHNGLDFEYFRLTSPIEARNKFEVAMMWHVDERKRCQDSLAALKLVKEKHPELHVTAFSAYDRPKDLPEWFSFVKKPDRDEHNRIYNNAAIYVAASEQEGCGLTPEESMICGCAVCCTDIGGFRDYAIDGKTALFSPVYNPAALADNICRLIEDDALRIRIAKTGAESIRQHTWDDAVSRFNKQLAGGVVSR